MTLNILPKKTVPKLSHSLSLPLLVWGDFMGKTPGFVDQTCRNTNLSRLETRLLALFLTYGTTELGPAIYSPASTDWGGF